MAGTIQSWEQDDAGENFNIEGADDKNKKEIGTLDTSTEEAIYNERTLLGTAIVNGDLEEVKRLVADGEPVDEVGKWGYTPLHAAANLGHNEIVKFLIDNGANVDRVDNEMGETPLHVAKTAEVVETLLAAGANPEIGDKFGNNALHLASYSGNIEVINALLDSGANKEAKNNEGQTALHLAALTDKPESIKALAERGANVNTTDSRGYSPLHHSALFDYNESAKALLESKANPDAIDPEGSTAAHIAAIFGYNEIIDSLAEHRANLNAKDSDGFTPLDYADEINEKATANTLINHGGVGSSSLPSDNSDSFTIEPEVAAAANPPQAAQATAAKPTKLMPEQNTTSAAAAPDKTSAAPEPEKLSPASYAGKAYAASGSPERLVKEAQAMLELLDYDTGRKNHEATEKTPANMDGIVGEKADAAIRAFQQKQLEAGTEGIAVNGELDDATMKALKTQSDLSIASPAIHDAAQEMTNTIGAASDKAVEASKEAAQGFNSLVAEVAGNLAFVADAKNMLGDGVSKTEARLVEQFIEQELGDKSALQNGHLGKRELANLEKAMKSATQEELQAFASALKGVQTDGKPHDGAPQAGTLPDMSFGIEQGIA